MINLTGQLTPKELIQSVFQPLIASTCSPLAEEICLKNNLTFTEMIGPFSKISSDAVSIKGLNICDINWRPPQTHLARKMLNESVTSNYDTVKEFELDDKKCINIPSSNPWFDNWRETFFNVQFPSDHEFTKHFLCNLIVVSSSDPNPVEQANTLAKKVQQLQVQTAPPKLPKWISNEVYNCYLMLHDGGVGELSQAQQGFENLKASFGESRCFLVQINSFKEPQSFIPDPWAESLKKCFNVRLESTNSSAPKTPQDITVNQIESPPPGTVVMSQIEHPLSPLQENAPELLSPLQTSIYRSTSNDSLTIPQTINPNVWFNEKHEEAYYPHGMYLSTADCDNLKHFTQDLTIRALIPYYESLITVLNESITNKKSVSKSLLGATKRWFITNKPGVNPAQTQNAVVYTSESGELQTRKLGDLYFMFGNYNLAYNTFHQLKRDFCADSAWQYYAGSLEMAALSAFMQGAANRKTYDYMEEAINTYLNICKMPQFATRATLLSAECLKAALLYGEAAKQLTRMTSEDSDLRSALLLEQAAYCFLFSQPAFSRKYAFHSVLAGHRYSKASQRKHAFRMYKQAEQVFLNKGWNLAEDHIQYTISKQAISLKKLEEASNCLAYLLRPSSLQSCQQQAGFLREYLATQKTFIDQSTSDELHEISLPKIIQNSVRVLVTIRKLTSYKPATEMAKNIDINCTSIDETWKWKKLEEMLVQSAAKKQIMMFKPTRSLYTGDEPTNEHPLCVLGEPIEISFELVNPIKPPIVFENIYLLWEFKKDSGELFSNRNLFKESSCYDENTSIIVSSCDKTLEFGEFERKTVNIALEAQCMGYCRIVGVAGKVSAANEKNSIWGKLNFDRTPIRVTDNTQIPNKLDYDRKLEIQILQRTSSLNVSFTKVPGEVLSGEIIPICIEMSNYGPNVINEIYLATDCPQNLIIIPGANCLPLSIQKDLRDTISEAFNKDKEARKQYVYNIFVSDDGAKEIAPDDTKSVSAFIQAPQVKGLKSIKILIYYNVAENYPKIKYRLVRHEFIMNVNECLSLKGNCNFANEETGEIGLDLVLKNTVPPVNQSKQAIEFSIGEVFLYCGKFAFEQKRIYYIKNSTFEKFASKNLNLAANDSLNIHCILNEKNEDENAPKFPNSEMEYFRKKLSSFMINPSKDLKDGIFCMASMDNFLIRYETQFLAFAQQNITNEDINNILHHSNKHMTICVNWRATLKDSVGNDLRNASGQHFVQIENLFESIYCPPKNRAVLAFGVHEEPINIYNLKKGSAQKETVFNDEFAENAVNNGHRCFLEVL